MQVHNTKAVVSDALLFNQRYSSSATTLILKLLNVTTSTQPKSSSFRRFTAISSNLNPTIGVQQLLHLSAFHTEPSTPNKPFCSDSSSQPATIGCCIP